MITVRGIKFPLEFRGGRVVLSTDEQHISESIIQLIGIAKGEYLMKLDFGSGLPNRVFDPTNVMALAAIDVGDVLRKYESRIDLVSVSANLIDSSLGVVSLSVGFRIKNNSDVTSINFSLGK
jgi:phage baseplate assembly protein W